jgi:hypothetical protein
MRDFEAYYAAGATWRSGADPYARDIWQAERTIPGIDAARDEILPFVSPPWTLPTLGALSLLPYHAAGAVWRVLLLAAALALAIAALRFAGSAAGGSLAATAIFCLAFAPLTSAFALGQMTLLAAGAAASAAVLRRPLLTALGLFFASWQPNAGLPALALLRSRRGLAAAVLAAGAALLLTLASGAAGSLARYGEIVAAHGGAEACASFQVTVPAVACVLRAPAFVSGVWIAAGAIASLAIAFARRGDPASAFIALSALTPLWLPFAHEHTLVMALVPALVCLRTAEGANWHLGAAGALLVSTNWLAVASTPQTGTQVTLAACAAALAAIALAPRPPRKADAGLLAIPILAAAFTALAAPHLPLTWPESLPRHFHTGAASAAGAWRAELVAAGLTQGSPASAIARALSLFGCALLALASLRLRELRYRRS